ncbi:MAG: hypothetical protein JSV52_07295 [Candidatus Zixiibacteriota bacterium]|nr:MAG: hypothetical protein JSV52_07295 [candidate division Zixibacteria bacterium]
MVYSKDTVSKVVALCLIAALVIPVRAFGASDLTWINFTSMRNIRQMRFINDTVFIVSSGGVLAVGQHDEQGRKYVNLDGLGTNDVSDIIQDQSGQKWITGFGRLIRFGGDDSRQFLFFDLDDKLFPLNCVVDDGDNLWVGTDLGLALFSKIIDGGQIQDSYQLFADLNPAPEVYDIMLGGDSIWIATSSGLAVADRTDPLLLKSPASWTGYSRGEYSELETDTIINVASFNSDVYVATRRGVFRMDRGATTSFYELPIYGVKTINQMKTENDSLFVYWLDTAGAYGVVDADTLVRLSMEGITGTPGTGAGDGDMRWVATPDGVFYSTATGYVEYPHLGMPGNDVSDLVIDSDGVISAGFRKDALARLEGGTWIEYEADLWAGTTDLALDPFGRAWAGSRGGSLWLFDGDTLAHYNDTNSSLIGIDRWYGYVLGLVAQGNYLYVGSYLAANDYPVAIADLNNLNDLSGWDSIGVENGLTDDVVVDVDVHGSQLAVATEQQGIFVCDIGNDPFTSNITCQQLTRENSLLISNNTRRLKYSPNGDLYVGTTNGLSWYDRGIDFFRDVDLPPEVGAGVTSLEFDGRGNLWVGTSEGLVWIEASSGERHVYNTLNSGIAGDVINSVTFDSFTGDVYISTTSGFSLIPSRMGMPTDDVELVVAFPNPFVIDDSNDRLDFNFGREGDVRIFNVAGELVRQTVVGDAWDGKNDKGEGVSSGVYIFIITDREGRVGKGKILLVRQ